MFVCHIGIVHENDPWRNNDVAARECQENNGNESKEKSQDGSELLKVAQDTSKSTFGDSAIVVTLNRMSIVDEEASAGCTLEGSHKGDYLNPDNFVDVNTNCLLKETNVEALPLTKADVAKMSLVFDSTIKHYTTEEDDSEYCVVDLGGLLGSFAKQKCETTKNCRPSCKRNWTLVKFTR